MSDTTLDGDRILPVTLRCDMTHECTEPVTHVDNKGYIYCTAHGISRRDVRPCRKLRPHELNRLRKGQPLTRY